jgi:hypothetical protein
MISRRTVLRWLGIGAAASCVPAAAVGAGFKYEPARVCWDLECPECHSGNTNDEVPAVLYFKGVPVYNEMRRG